MTLSSIVTVTLNPALDMTGNMGQLLAGSVNIINQSKINPGGKGINVAKVLAELGAKVVVTGFLGDENQSSFVDLFAKKGIDDQFIRVAGASRINVKLVEQDKRVTDLNFPGVRVDEAAIVSLEQKIMALAKQNDIFVIAGSLPNGMNTDILVRWIKTLREQGKKVIFDSSQQALAQGLKAIPWLVKPNDEELSHWIGYSLDNQQDLLDAGEKLAATGIENVVISRGENGVLWCQNGHWLASSVPKMSVVSTVGAGDTLVAGFCWALINDWSQEQTLSFATALSALAVTQVNVGVENSADVVQFQHKIKIEKLNH